MIIPGAQTCNLSLSYNHLHFQELYHKRQEEANIEALVECEAVSIIACVWKGDEREKRYRHCTSTAMKYLSTGCHLISPIAVTVGMTTGSTLLVHVKGHQCLCSLCAP